MTEPRAELSARPRAIARLAIAAGAAAVTAVAGAMPTGCRSGERVRPNVLLVTVDTLRADHLGSYGFGFDASPNIDARAASGLVFENAIAAAGKTPPAHASIMTSRYVREHSVGHGNGSNTLGTEKTLVERVARNTTQRALAWLRESANEPFFLWTHDQDPHGPYTPPPDVRDRFRLPAAPDEKELPIQTGNSAGGGIPAHQVLPTLLDLAGLPVPSDASGISLAPMAGKPTMRLERFVFRDNGGQLSAYRCDTFVWMVGVGSAWRRPEGPGERTSEPRWALFRWSPGDGWTRTGDGASLPAEVGGYAAKAVAMNPLPPPGEEGIERLRALGYAD